MKIIRKSNAISYQIPWLTLLLAMVYLWPANVSETASADATQQNHMFAAIRIVDQFGRQAPTGKRYVGSDIFDVAVGPVGKELQFVPDSINIVAGDTVRWTWYSDFHSVTSGTSCTADGQFCSPDNMNCEAGILNDKGFVYEYTFTEAGTAFKKKSTPQTGCVLT